MSGSSLRRLEKSTRLWHEPVICWQGPFLSKSISVGSRIHASQFHGGLFGATLVFHHLQALYNDEICIRYGSLAARRSSVDHLTTFPVEVVELAHHIDAFPASIQA